MPRMLALAAILMLGSLLTADEYYKKATVVRMELVRCSGAEPESFKNMMMGHSDPRDPGVCREYLLRTERVLYTIRSRRDMLLPVGEDVRFRLARKEMVVRADDSDEMRFFVASMVMASEEPARVRPGRKCLNVAGEIIDCIE